MKRRHFIKNSSLAALASLTHIGQAKRLTAGMNYRRLGRTNMMISEISLGGSPVPPEAIFRRAMEAGINYVDTSSSYMNGHSELLIGKILKDYPGKLYVATKFHAGRQGYNKNLLVKEFEGSLKRLAVSEVDILMVHGARNAEILANHEVLNLFEKFKKQGKIRFTGISCHYNPVEVLMPAIKSGLYDMIAIAYNAFSGSLINRQQVYRNYLEKSGIEGLINLAAKYDVGVIAMKTMAGGNRQKLDIYRKKGVSLAQAKLKWVLENKQVASALSEMVTFDMLDENIKACQSPLSSLEKKSLIHQVKALSSQYCRMCGQCVRACPFHIAIPDILRYTSYYLDYRKPSLAKEKYKKLPKKYSYQQCNQCQLCQQSCPYQLAILPLLDSAHQLLT